MTANSPKTRKAKGRKFQQEIARDISDVLGIPIEKDGEIESRPMGQSGPDIILRGDAKADFPFTVETKFTERWDVHKWVDQAKKYGDDWLLFCKKSRSSPVVIMDKDVFFDLYALLLHLRDIAEDGGLLNE